MKRIISSGINRSWQYLIPAIIMLCLMELSSFAYGYEDDYNYGYRSDGQGKSSGNINIFWGAKALDEEDWAPADEQDEVGVTFDIGSKGGSFNFSVAFLSGTGKGTGWDPSIGNFEFTSKTTEFNIGIKKIWDANETTHPFIGGGLSSATASAELEALGSSTSDSAGGVGIWISFGVFWTFNERYNFGIEMISSSVSVNISDVDTDAGGGHFGFFFGTHW